MVPTVTGSNPDRNARFLNQPCNVNIRKKMERNVNIVLLYKINLLIPIQLV